MRYTWDEAKREKTLRERGIDFADAHLVYENPNKITFASPRNDESRKLDIAMVEVFGVVLVLVYLEQEDAVRVISFRRASRFERRQYAEAKQN